MDPQEADGARAFPTVPTVIFANGREVPNRSGLADRVRSGYALAITGYLDLK